MSTTTTTCRDFDVSEIDWAEQESDAKTDDHKDVKTDDVLQPYKSQTKPDQTSQVTTTKRRKPLYITVRKKPHLGTSQHKQHHSRSATIKLRRKTDQKTPPLAITSYESKRQFSTKKDLALKRDANTRLETIPSRSVPIQDVLDITTGFGSDAETSSTTTTTTITSHHDDEDDELHFADTNGDVDESIAHVVDDVVGGEDEQDLERDQGIRLSLAMAATQCTPKSLSLSSAIIQQQPYDLDSDSSLATRTSSSSSHSHKHRRNTKRKSTLTKPSSRPKAFWKRHKASKS